MTVINRGLPLIIVFGWAPSRDVIKFASALLRSRTECFCCNGGVRTQQQELTSAVSGDFFGGLFAVDGDTLITGAQGDNQSQGAAYVFVHSGTTWTRSRS